MLFFDSYYFNLFSLLMPKITYKDNHGNSKTIEVENGLSVMEGRYSKRYTRY